MCATSPTEFVQTVQMMEDELEDPDLHCMYQAQTAYQLYLLRRTVQNVLRTTPDTTPPLGLKDFILKFYKKTDVVLDEETKKKALEALKRNLFAATGFTGKKADDGGRRGTRKRLPGRVIRGNLRQTDSGTGSEDGQVRAGVRGSRKVGQGFRSGGREGDDPAGGGRSEGGGGD
jgi:hypothetical protein